MSKEGKIRLSREEAAALLSGNLRKNFSYEQLSGKEVEEEVMLKGVTKAEREEIEGENDAVVAVALYNFEIFYSMRYGTASVQQVERSSAGIAGWAQCEIEPSLSSDGTSIKRQKVNGTQTDLGSAVEHIDSCLAGSARLNNSVRSDEEESRQLRAALLESIGVSTETSAPTSLLHLLHMDGTADSATQPPREAEPSLKESDSASNSSESSYSYESDDGKSGEETCHFGNVHDPRGDGRCDPVQSSAALGDTRGTAPSKHANNMNSTNEDTAVRSATDLPGTDYIVVERPPKLDMRSWQFCDAAKTLESTSCADDIPSASASSSDSSWSLLSEDDKTKEVHSENKEERRD